MSVCGSAAGGELAADVDQVAAQVRLSVERVVGAGGAHGGVGGRVAGDGDDGAAVAGAAEVGDRAAAVLAAVAEREVHEHEGVAAAAAGVDGVVGVGENGDIDAGDVEALAARGHDVVEDRDPERVGRGGVRGHSPNLDDANTVSSS